MKIKKLFSVVFGQVICFKIGTCICSYVKKRPAEHVYLF